MLFANALISQVTGATDLMNIAITDFTKYLLAPYASNPGVLPRSTDTWNIHGLIRTAEKCVNRSTSKIIPYLGQYGKLWGDVKAVPEPQKGKTVFTIRRGTYSWRTWLICTAANRIAACYALLACQNHPPAPDPSSGPATAKRKGKRANQS